MGSPALDVPEILYAILANVSQQDLLVSAQRVCRKWHHLITHTRTLQEALFLRPSSPHRALSAGFKFNPLLKSHFPAFFDGRRFDKTPSDTLGPWDAAAWVRGWPIPNYPFEDFEAKDFEDWETRGRKHNVQQDLPDQSQCLDKETAARLDAYARSDASWRRMVPCQPVPTELQVHCGIRKNFGVTRSDPSLLSKGELHIINFVGAEDNSRRYLTFGVLYDIAEDAWCEGNVGFVKSLRIDYFGADYVASSDNDGIRQSLREAFPEKTIGGFGTVVLHLDGRMACMSYHYEVSRSMSETWRHGRFKSDGRTLLKDIVWDEEWKFARNPA